MSCTVTAPGGANVNCKSYLSEANAAAIFDPSVTWATLQALDNIENIRTYLQESRTGFVVEFNGTEPTAAEAVTETTGFGDNIITAENTPSLLAYAEMNACDFKEVLSAYKGGSYRVVFFLSDGNAILTEVGNEYGGFMTQVYAHRFGIPGRENQSQQYRITFNFLRGSEFDNYRVAPVNYSADDLFLLLPLGLQADVKTPYVSGTGIVELNVYTRCVPDSPKSGALTVEIVKTNSAATAVTGVATDNGGGEYSVTISADAGQLAAGEYAEFILVSKTGNVYDEVSNKIKVVG